MDPSVNNDQTNTSPSADDSGNSSVPAMPVDDTATPFADSTDISAPSEAPAEEPVTLASDEPVDPPANDMPEPADSPVPDPSDAPEESAQADQPEPPVLGSF